MNVLQRLRTFLDKVLEVTLVVIMGAMVLAVLWQVFSRFILHAPSSYTEELVRFLLIWVSLLGAAYAVSKRLHLAIDYFTLKFKGRQKLFSGLFIDVCVFLFALFVMTVGGLNLVTLTFTLNQVSAALGLKMGYVYLVLPLSGVLILFYAGLQIAERLRTIMGIDEAAPTEEPTTTASLD